MADTIVSSSPAAPAKLPSMDHGATGDRAGPKPSMSKKKAATSKPRKASAQALDHPKYSVMIAYAISRLKERGGSSRQAILKFITGHYKVGSEHNKVNARVKVALKSGVKTGALKQSKGTGAAGSFRLGDKKRTTAEKPKSRTKAAKPASGKSLKKGKTAVRKPKSPAKKPAAKKTKAKSPAKKLKSAAKKVKTALKSKPKTKSPAKKVTKQKKQTKKAAKK